MEISRDVQYVQSLQHMYSSHEIHGGSPHSPAGLHNYPRVNLYFPHDDGLIVRNNRDVLLYIEVMFV